MLLTAFFLFFFFSFFLSAELLLLLFFLNFSILLKYAFKYLIIMWVHTSNKHYVHRAGRVGRTGRAGIVISLATTKSLFILKKFSEELGIPIKRMEVHSKQLLVLP
jgi:hypothetical protein